MLPEMWKEWLLPRGLVSADNTQPRTCWVWTVHWGGRCNQGPWLHHLCSPARCSLLDCVSISPITVWLGVTVPVPKARC